MFKGFSAFPITPADANGRVDTENLAVLLERLVSAKVDSIGLLGSTGTYMFLNRQERLRAVQAAVDCVAGRVPIIVSVGTIRTDEAVALAGDAAGAGADGLLLAPVSYTPLTEEEVFGHFTAVAGATDLPLCIYDNPGTTHFSFSRDLIVRLAENPNIKSVKMAPSTSKADDIKALRARVPSDFAIGYSGDWEIADAMQSGADSFFSAVGGLLPRELKKLFDAAQNEDAQSAAAADVPFNQLWGLCKAHGSLRVIYAAAHLMDLTAHQLPAPLRPIDQIEDLRPALQTLGVLKP